MDEDIIRIGVRGRLTIPKHIREKVDLRYRDAYRVHVVAGLLLLERVDEKKDTKGTVPLDSFISGK